MHDHSLAGRSVLVVEDEYMIADDLAQAFEDAGAEVVGPAPTVAQALALIQGGSKIDVAVLDVNLDGERVWQVAETLAKRATPFLVVTGYDALALPSQFRNAIRLEKPVDLDEVVKAANRLME